MKLSDIDLPSNHRFGFFFAALFLGVGIYSFLGGVFSAAYGFSILGFLFLVVTIVSPNVLLPLNTLWMRFGLLLGRIVSPLVLAAIFFGLFTPISLFLSLIGRDELRLRFKKKPTHWILCQASPMITGTFKNQF